MKKISLGILLWLFIGSTLCAQSISDVVLSQDGKRMAFVKDGDSLFVKSVATAEKAVFIDSGLRDNGNQRFLHWTPDSGTLVYEKGENVRIYSCKAQTTRLVRHQYLDSLSLFQFYLIQQTAVNNQDELFFSAELKNTAETPSQLYRLNLKSGAIRQLTDSPLHVSNVALSKDQRYLTFASYQFTENIPQTKITIISPNSGKVIAETGIYTGSFFSELKWSDESTQLLAIDSGNNSKLLTFDSWSGLKEGPSLRLSSDERPITFYNKKSVLYGDTKSGKSRIGRYDLVDHTKKILVGNGAEYLSYDVGPRKRQLYFLTESPKQPKTLARTVVGKHGIRKVTSVNSFSSKNPLQEYYHLTYWYMNADGDSTSSQIYFPKTFMPASGKKYPLLVIPYGGYDNSYPDLGYFLNEVVFDYLNQGYIIAFPNTRGIGYERQTDNYGRLQLEDTEKYIHELGKTHSIDQSRIIALGHSHGATMVYYYSSLFSGGVAINGAADWIKQAERKSMAGLPFGMGGMPAELEAKYEQFSPYENIERLKAPLLIIAGKEDTQIPYDLNALAFYKKAKESGKQVKLIVFDDEGHLIDLFTNKQVLKQEIKAFIYGNTEK
ncbi:S9 family peptidase [Pontibacter harenae]|uniref:S9 family peptidase n=1 Tax=Pontibacter harenae TaxID=2894083 RepID=UPI001E2A9FA6|nr:alpha/beta fold hydrolase [Pontibacter harenae]MCC9167889.1 prolyl oligopeptidase family serine peptidase [Pontibacter harenae]